MYTMDGSSLLVLQSLKTHGMQPGFAEPSDNRLSVKKGDFPRRIGVP